MAKIGVKSLTYAKYSAGGDGEAITYTGGVMLKDYMVRAELTKNNNKTDEYADDHRIDVENSVNSVALALELANLDATMMDVFAGMKAGSTTGTFVQTDGGAPYIGVGYITCNRFKGVVTYDGIWVHKIQFHQDSVAADTKGENLAFAHENVTGDAVGVILTSGGDVIYYDMIKGQSTEAAVETWLKGHAGIT